MENYHRILADNCRKESDVKHLYPLCRCMKNMMYYHYKSSKEMKSRVSSHRLWDSYHRNIMWGSCKTVLNVNNLHLLCRCMKNMMYYHYKSSKELKSRVDSHRLWDNRRRNIGWGMHNQNL
jgi:hypothetical protein